MRRTQLWKNNVYSNARIVGVSHFHKSGRIQNAAQLHLGMDPKDPKKVKFLWLALNSGGALGLKLGLMH